MKVNYEKIEGVLPETTLFLHGNLCSSRFWYPVEQELKRAARGKNYTGSLVLGEFRGCGKSPAPLTPEEINMHTFADDFIEVAEKVGNGRPINLVGHSTGGLVAVLMMAKAPNLFNKAVLLDPVGAKGVKFDNSMIDAFEAMKVNKDLVATVMASTILDCQKESDFFRQVVVEDAFQAVNTIGVGILKALDGIDIRTEVSKVSQPVLVLHGEHDLLLPMQDSREMAQMMTAGKFEILKGQGHCANVENPAQFASTTSQFLFA